MTGAGHGQLINRIGITRYLLKEFTKSILWADIEVYLSSLKAIVSKDLLQTGGTHTFFHTIHGEAGGQAVHRYGWFPRE